MNTRFSFFLIFFNILLQGQNPKYYVFQPNFEFGKNYFLEVTTNEHLNSKNGKESNPSIDFVKLKIKKEQVINEEIYYSLEVLEKDHRHLDGKNQKKTENNFKGVVMKFKTSSEGKYIAIVNLENIKFQIKQAFSDEKIKQIAKSSSDKLSIAQNLKYWRDNPQVSIAAIEHNIITYFRYYNIKIPVNKETYGLRLERFPFLNSFSLPYKSDFEFVKNDEVCLLKINNSVIKKKITNEEYENLAKCCYKTLSSFKDNYKNEFQELVMFNFSNALISDYVLKAQISSINGDGGIWNLERIYKLTHD